MSDQRAKFEAWIASQPGFSLKRDGDGYDWMSVQFAWEAWQESIKQLGPYCTTCGQHHPMPVPKFEKGDRVRIGGEAASGVLFECGKR